MNNVFGVDIAKESFEVFHQGEQGDCFTQQWGNDAPGHIAFRDALPRGACIVMEASGPYHLRLASVLYAANFTVIVLNPLSSRRYAQMKLLRAKTDRIDARLLAEYGTIHYPDLSPWEPPKAVFTQLRQLNTSVNLLHKQLRMLLNQQAAFAVDLQIDPVGKQVQDQLISELTIAIKRLEAQMNSLCKTHCQETYQRLQSIPGIGPKTAALLIAITREFSSFESAKQLVSYIGLCPRIYRSGTSVKGKESIVKMGQSTMRACLYMAAFSAMRYNPDCRARAEKMRQKGKHYRVIRVAIAHQLIRQAFAVVTQKTEFEPKINLIKS
ncbi:MAG: IS110 family transposase [Bacteroidota bacterium]